MNTEAYTVQTDSRSRAVLRGQPNRLFIARENDDGTILLTPGRIVSEAQHEYDTTPELRELLAKAAASPTVTRRRRRTSS